MRYVISIVLLGFLFSLGYAQESSIPEITLNNPQEVMITAELPVQRILQLEEEQYIQLQVTSATDEIDPVVWILDNDNRLLGYNDNISSDDTTAQLQNLLLEAGQYRIWIDSFNGVSDGTVSVSVASSQPMPITIATTDEEQIISSVLLRDTMFRYRLEVDRADRLTITARDTSGTLDPYLTVLSADNQVLQVNDDHGSASLALNVFDAQINDWVVGDREVIIIQVHDFLGRAGSFDLLIGRN